MIIQAWWFENKQKEEEILQPAWFYPKTHCGIYAEFQNPELPFCVVVQAFEKEQKIFEKVVDIVNEESAEYDLLIKNDAVLIKIFADHVTGLPDTVRITIKIKDQVYEKRIRCKYSHIQGTITDFNGNPFPAAVVFMRKAFGGKRAYIGAWTDKEGRYSVIVPNGFYCAFYAEDNSYKVSTLENWSWRMCVDRDETLNFKIGTGEVYALSVREDFGGGNFLILYFRPMILPQIKMQEYKITLNGTDKKVTDIQPDLDKKDLKVLIDDKKAKVLSLQKIYETGIRDGKEYVLIAYIAQIEKPLLERGKHTVIVEYQTDGKYKTQSQGRTHYFVGDLL